MNNQYIRITVIAFAVMALFDARLLAADPKSTPDASATDTPFQMPDIGKLSSQMLTQIFAESLKPERAVQLARFQRLYYEALIKEGFSKQEAFELLKAGASAFGASQ